MAALSAACHNRSEDETGAAPDRTGTVTATDSASISTDSTMGQRPGATDTSAVRQDTTSMGAPAPSQGDSALTNQAAPDSSGMGAMHDSMGMGAMHDSMGMGAMHDSMGMNGMSHDSMPVQGDSALTNSTEPDTTARQ
ncbi:MAG: hypothetical protein ABI703_09885 [Gemmatimonadales bacterium]